MTAWGLGTLFRKRGRKVGSASTDFLLAQCPLSPESGTHSKRGANACSKDERRKEWMWKDGRVKESSRREMGEEALSSGFSCF